MKLTKVNTTVDVDSYVQSSAKYYSLKLVRNGYYNFYETDDLEQELLALFCYQIKKYPHDPNKSSEKHWVSIVMEDIYKNLKSKSIRESKYISKVSLNDSISSNYSSISNSSKVNNSNHNKSNESEIIDFIQDDKSNTFETYYKQKTKETITQAIESMPNDLKDICRHLQTDNISDISKKLNISRKTIYQKIHKIKSIFEKCGIDKDWDL